MNRLPLAESFASTHCDGQNGPLSTRITGNSEVIPGKTGSEKLEAPLLLATDCGPMMKHSEAIHLD